MPDAWLSFTPRERGPGTHWIGGWVDPRAGLNDEEKRKFLTLPGLVLRLLGRPARSQSPYRLSYPGSYFSKLHFNITFPFTSWSLLFFVWDGIAVNWKGCGNSLEYSWETSVRIFGFPVEIRTGYFPSTSKKSCRLKRLSLLIYLFICYLFN
jgi:hypothetical protein